MKIFYKMTDTISVQEEKEMWDVLGEERKKELQGLVNEEMKMESLVGEYLLRKSLESLCGREAKSFHIIREKGKKPYLLDSEWQFNLSHTKGCVMLALAKSPVGVDIEKSDRKANSLNKLCTGGDKSFIKDHAMELWTRKEALVKCMGLGIMSPYIKTEVGLGEKILSLNERTFRLNTVEGPKGYCAAVCLEITPQDSPSK